MGTEIQCNIDQCKYWFDGWCTRGEIIVTIYDNQPVCSTFYDIQQECQPKDSADQENLFQKLERESKNGEPKPFLFDP